MEQQENKKTPELESQRSVEGNPDLLEEKTATGEESPATGRPRRRGSFRKESDAKKSDGSEGDFIEKVLSIRRVTKVTKGGKKLSFSALVVVGDGKSNVGFAQDKAGEVATAIRKAMSAAKKKMVKIPLKGTTIPHEIIGAWGSARVLLKPAGEGTGVIASGPVRAVCEGAGIHNILTKCHRSNNPVNIVKATMRGLTSLKSPKVNLE
ncbi:MAG: 30S ribosomal protein S5 [Candidatus Omnitrophota bacterium]